ncbi:hypothetical protein COU80_00160 [Candidatus Peregrinibacteria bacterium CG10_big_fil_rev_8_21_14_0_10_55_24]|nr:MAG: hypothetical protein COU80_00160 [Candidatus Peregrinibacteria bacterium CG10_big_fil_rev_8_21_14_0_10_55_24]
MPEGKASYIYDSNRDAKPLAVVDVGGHNVVVYAERNIWRTSDGILTPDLHLTFNFPDMDEETRKQHCWDCVGQIRKVFQDQLGHDTQIAYANDGIILTPKAVEHSEREAGEASQLQAHPAFFESREGLSRKILAGVTALQQRIYGLLNDPNTAQAEQLSSDPPATQESFELAKRALASAVWYYEEEKEVHMENGAIGIEREHWKSFITPSADQAEEMAAAKLDHGLRTLFAQMALDIGVVHRRKCVDGQLWILRATPESCERLVASGIGSQY